jgi:hypothetical protein
LAFPSLKKPPPIIDMSTNGQLVFTDVDKITFKGVGNASNAVIDTLTGKIGVGVDSPEANLHVVGNSYVSTNLELGGTLIMGTVNVEAQHSLEAVTATGNTTPLTLEFTNPTTSLVASGNVEVAGNVTAGYLYGDGSNISGISSTLQAITDSGNVTSNTVQFTNATTSLVASGNVEVGGELIVSGNIYNNANLSVQYTTITPTLWTQVGQDIDGEAAGDESGYSVSMSSDGTRVAIGAVRNDGTGTDAGHVRVYDWNSATPAWEQVGGDIDGEAADDRSGYSVSMSSDGTRVAIGAARNDGTGSDAGHVRVYAESGGLWTKVGGDIDGEAVDDRFGHSVSMSSNGTRVAIGAKQNDGNGSNSGHVRVFDWPVKSKKILKDDIVEVGGELTVSGNVGIGTSSPIAALDIDGGPENDTVPALSIRGGLYDTSDLYVLNTYNVNTGVGYAAKVIGVNIKNKVETDNTVQLRNNVGGLTSAGAIYLGSDNTTSQGVFGVLTCQGIAGTTLTEKFTVTDSGNVGIGTTSPAIQLDVRGTNAKLGRVLTGNVHEVYKRDSVDIGRWDDTTLSDGFSGMRCRVDTHTALGYGSYSNQTEIGFYAWGNSIAGSRQVFAINAYGNGNMIGTLTQSSNGTTSDDRIKYNEEDITSPLTLISQLNPQKYEKIVSVAVSEKEGIWIPTDEEWESVKSEYTYVDEFGFIAQDVRAVPELSFLVNGEETRTDTNTLTPEEYSNLTSEEQVTYTPSYVYESNTITQQEYSNLTHEEQGVCTTQYTKQIETQTPLSLNYNGLFVLAIGAIKELKAENDAIKARLDALENA